MRRKERQITDINEIKEVIASNKVIRIGFNDENHVYIVPVNYGFDEKDGKFTFYFHGARDGRKFSLISKGGTAGFEMDCDYELMTGEIACDYSAYYSSVIGEGTVSEITDNEEKKKALNLVMLNASGKGDWNFPSIMLSRVGVFKLEATELSCKKHKAPKMM